MIWGGCWWNMVWNSGWQLEMYETSARYIEQVRETEIAKRLQPFKSSGSGTIALNYSSGENACQRMWRREELVRDVQHMSIFQTMLMSDKVSILVWVFDTIDWMLSLWSSFNWAALMLYVPIPVLISNMCKDLEIFSSNRFQLASCTQYVVTLCSTQWILKYEVSFYRILSRHSDNSLRVEV